MLSFIIVFAERKKAISIFLFWDFYIPFLQLFVCVPSSLLFLYFSLLSFNPIIYLPVFITWLPGAPRTQKRSIFRKCSPFQIFFSSAKCTKVLLMYGSQIRYVLGLCDPKFKTACIGWLSHGSFYLLYIVRTLTVRRRGVNKTSTATLCTVSVRESRYVYIIKIWIQIS